jgi:hypothetical protein
MKLSTLALLLSLPAVSFARDPNLFDGYFTSMALGFNYTDFSELNQTSNTTISGNGDANIAINSPINQQKFYNGTLEFDGGYGVKLGNHFYLSADGFVELTPAKSKQFTSLAATNYPPSIPTSTQVVALNNTLETKPLSYGIRIEPGFVYKKFNTINLVLGYVWQTYGLRSQALYGSETDLQQTAELNKDYRLGAFQLGLDYYYNLGPNWYLNIKLLHDFASKKQALNQDISTSYNNVNYQINNSFSAVQNGTSELLLGVTYNFS